MTAHRALTVADGGPARLGPGTLDGRTVLVAGGAGAVGHAAIQLARWSGARVVTTVSSPEKAALATAAGAHHVVDYTEGDTAKAIRAIAPDGVDLVVEVSPARNAALNARVIANHGTISVYATDGGAEMTLDVRRHFALNVRYQFLLLYTVGDAPSRPPPRTSAVRSPTARSTWARRRDSPHALPARTHRRGARRRGGGHRRQGAHRRGGADGRLIPPGGGCRGVP